MVGDSESPILCVSLPKYNVLPQIAKNYCFDPTSFTDSAKELQSTLF